jgi:hypothetical protein
MMNHFSGGLTRLSSLSAHRGAPPDSAFVKHAVSELSRGKNVVLQQKGAGRHGQRARHGSAGGRPAQGAERSALSGTVLAARWPAARERGAGSSAQQRLLNLTRRNNACAVQASWPATCAAPVAAAHRWLGKIQASDNAPPAPGSLPYFVSVADAGGPPGSRDSQGAETLFRLVHVPEHRRRRAIEHPGQRLAPAARDQILAERNIDHLVVVLLLDFGGDLLLLVRR